MPKSASKTVQDSQAKAGKKRKQVVLPPARLAQLDRLVAQHGTITAVFEAGMDALEGRNEISKSAVLAWIERNTG